MQLIYGRFVSVKNYHPRGADSKKAPDHYVVRRFAVYTSPHNPLWVLSYLLLIVFDFFNVIISDYESIGEEFLS